MTPVKQEPKTITLTSWEKSMILGSLASIMVLGKEENHAFVMLLEKIKNA